jgi:glycosyltransferase involved in cell wall biosynthesis
VDRAKSQARVGWIGTGFEPGLVSVVIPTRDRAHLLGRALDSVARQDYRPIEIIVVDDGSIDDTCAAVRRWPGSPQSPSLVVRYLAQQHAGAPAARNRALRHSRGEYIQFLDSDDALASRKLGLQVAALRDFPGAAFATSPFHAVTDTRQIEAKESDCALEPFWTIDPRSLSGNVSAGLFRRTAIVAVGPWNEALSCFQDWEYSVRLTDLGLVPGRPASRSTFISSMMAPGSETSGAIRSGACGAGWKRSRRRTGRRGRGGRPFPGSGSGRRR